MHQFRRHFGGLGRIELDKAAFGALEVLETRIMLSTVVAGTPVSNVPSSDSGTVIQSLSETVSSSWSSVGIATQKGSFQLTFSATPTQNDENAVIGLSDGAAGAYTDLAAIVRFNPTGQLDVRDGSDYQADNTVNYVAGTTYSFTMDVDQDTHSYSVYVTPAGGSQIDLASNYAFRTEQATTSVLNDVSGYALVGSADVSGIAASMNVDGNWENGELAGQDAPFQLSFDATPSQNDENVVLGLSDGPAGAYTDLAAIVRFNPNGQIDVRNGSFYQADSTVNYVAGTTYSFTMEVDPTTQTYSVFVTPAGGSQIELASNYAFRTEQATCSMLNNMGAFALVGSADVNNTAISSEKTPTPSSPSTPTPVLDAPSNLTASPASSSEIDLKWTDNSGGSEQGFDIFQSINGGSYSQIATVGSGVTSYSDIGLNASTSYSYEVLAFGGSETSTYSNAAAATTDSAPITTPPPTTSGTAGPTNTPGASNTGPVAGTVLTPESGGLGTTEDGQVIQNLAITGSGADSNHVIQVTNNNVTIENCTIDGNGMLSGCDIYIAPGVTGTTIINCSFTGTGDGSYVISVNGGANNTTISNCNFYYTAGSVFFFNSNNTTVENNWLHEIGWETLDEVNYGQTGDFHTDDVFIEAGTGYVFDNNLFDTPTSTTINGVNYSALRCFFVDPFNAADVVGTINIQNNYLDGGGSYMLQFMGQGGVTMANNVIGGDSHFGMIYPNYVGDAISWTNNVLSTTGQQLAPPVVSGSSLVSQPA